MRLFSFEILNKVEGLRTPHLTRIGKGSRFVEYPRNYLAVQGCELILWLYSFADAKLPLVK